MKRTQDIFTLHQIMFVGVNQSSVYGVCLIFPKPCHISDNDSIYLTQHHISKCRKKKFLKKIAAQNELEKKLI